MSCDELFPVSSVLSISFNALIVTFIFLSFVDVSACCGFGNLFDALKRGCRFVNTTAAVMLGKNIGVCSPRPGNAPGYSFLLEAESTPGP